MELSPVVEALIKEFEEPKAISKDGGHFSISRTVSALAVLYEKARNAVEFRAEHLVRRAAIERILKRRILLNGGSNTIAENLVIELLWARYIDSSLIDQRKIEEIQKIIERYVLVKQTYFTTFSRAHGIKWEQVIGLASSEIEETIVSSQKRDSLTNFFYQAIRPKIQIPGRDEDFTNIQSFIAAERAFAQADEQLVSYHLLKLMMPQWTKSTLSEHAALLPQFVQILQHIESHLKEKQSDALYRYARKQTAAFFLMRDLCLTLDINVRSTMEDEALLEQKLAELANKRYVETRSKVGRAIVRSFIYIFLTKMVFAIAIEAPYDTFIAKHVRYVPLIINLLFPPLLMALVAGLISVPGAENTKKLIERVKKIIYHFDELKNETDVFVVVQKTRRPILTGIFTLLYLFMFGLTFWFIHSMLSLLQFNFVSQTIFIFFVALVVFFAYRIRESTKEYQITDRQGVLEPVMDFAFLPVLQAGHMLSREITRLNLFIFLFDFVLEAPLKVIFEVADEWFRFIRVKKEEIV